MMKMLVVTSAPPLLSLLALLLLEQRLALATAPELRDRSGLPLIPMGSYSAEPVSARHAGIREFKTGVNTHNPLLPWENPKSCPASEWDGTYCGNSVRRDPLSEVHAWLDRADAVGTNIFYNLESIARSTADGVAGSGIRNTSCCPLQWQRIASEVREVMHHPSIVGWYIADEPDSGVVPDVDRVAVVAKVRETVLANDAKQRPTAACFDTTPAYYHGAHNWPDFLSATDIIMADIYEDDPGGGTITIGTGSSARTEVVYSWAVADAIDALVNASGGKRVILVPRIFSGRECYSTTVSPSSIRGQTYLAFIHGATGIMSFIHTGVTDGSRFHADADARGRTPASFNVYAEYTRLSLEFESITSALLGPKPSWQVTATATVGAHVHAALPIVHAAVFEQPARAAPAAAGAGVTAPSSLVVLAMNTQRVPTMYSITLSLQASAVSSGKLSNNTIASALFEGGGTAWDYAHPSGSPGPTTYGPRSVSLVCVSATECVLSDMIDSFGTRAYRIYFDHPPPSRVVLPQPCAGNITMGCNAVFNPSFEDLRGMDVPDGIWILEGNDTDSAILADSRDSVHGERSLRVHTAERGNGSEIVIYPVEAATTYMPNSSWLLSVWARGIGTPDPVSGLVSPPRFRVGVDYSFEYPWTSPCPADFDGPSFACMAYCNGTHNRKGATHPCVNTTLTNSWQLYTMPVLTPPHRMGPDSSLLYLTLEGSGVAWFDMLTFVCNDPRCAGGGV